MSGLFASLLRLRPVVRRVAPALAVTIFVAMVAAARCPASGGGHGLLVFAGDADSAALNNGTALGVNPLFRWADLEPSEGVYNWAPVDDTLEGARAHGKRIAPRVMTNEAEFGQATPQWVFDAGAESYAYDAESSIPQPVPTDPVFTRQFAQFVMAFGERYNGSAEIEFVQTNAGMGAYGEMVWTGSLNSHPQFWSAAIEIRTDEYWIDVWRQAFPDTHLVFMENFIGDEIAERVADYAVGRGYYLQANSPEQGRGSRMILARQADRTRIVLEIENNGCRDATGDAFDELIGRVFDQGFPIDYLMLCDESFADGARVQGAYDRLRKLR